MRLRRLYLIKVVVESHVVLSAQQGKSQRCKELQHSANEHDTTLWRQDRLLGGNTRRGAERKVLLSSLDRTFTNTTPWPERQAAKL